MAKRGASVSPPGSPPTGRAALSGRMRGGTPRAQSLKQVEESASLGKPVKRAAPSASGASPGTSNALVMGLGGAVIVLLLALVLLFSNQAASVSVAPAAAGSSQDWSEFIAEQLRQSEARLKALIEAKASQNEVAAAAARHLEVTEQLKSTLLVRLEQAAKEVAAVRESVAGKVEQEKQAVLSLLREEIRNVAEQAAPVASVPGGSAEVGEGARVAAELERKWQQLEEKLLRRVADVEQAAAAAAAQAQAQAKPSSDKAGSAAVLPPVVVEKKDYALEVTAASPTYKDYDAFAKYAIKVLGVTMRQSLPGPETVLAAPFVDNKCWSFAGTNGTLTVRLRERIAVGSVSLQQTKPALSFFVANAPRDFDVLDERDELLGSFVYDGAKTEATQAFVVKQGAETELLTFRFRSNHGASDFTCVGKIRVHK